MSEELYIKVYDWMCQLAKGNDLIVLALIYSLKEVTGQKYISERTGLAQPRVSEILSRLEKAGLIEAEHSGAKNKPTVFRYTENGYPKSVSHDIRKADNTLYGNRISRYTESGYHSINNKNIDRNIDSNTHINTARTRTGEVVAAECLVSLSVEADPELIKSILGFIDHRKKLKKPMTDNALQLNIKKAHKLAGGDPKKMTELFNLAVERGWQGIYQDKDQKGSIKNDTGKHERFFK